MNARTRAAAAALLIALSVGAAVLAACTLEGMRGPRRGPHPESLR